MSAQHKCRWIKLLPATAALKPSKTAYPAGGKKHYMPLVGKFMSATLKRRNENAKAFQPINAKPGSENYLQRLNTCTSELNEVRRMQKSGARKIQRFTECEKNRKP
ncbi:hypothetical protein BCS63_022900, partial [Vibrio cyclitrophicus]